MNKNETGSWPAEVGWKEKGQGGKFRSGGHVLLGEDEWMPKQEKY